MIQVYQPNPYITENYKRKVNRRFIPSTSNWRGHEKTLKRNINWKGLTEIHIPAFDIHHKTIGNGNGKICITTSVYKIKCHPDDSKIMKTLLARCSEHGSNGFSFIPYGFPQITTNETYRRQIVLYKNYLANIAVVLIHGISKEGMKDEAEHELNKISGIKSIKETYLTERNRT